MTRQEGLAVLDAVLGPEPVQMHKPIAREELLEAVHKLMQKWRAEAPPVAPGKCFCGRPEC